MLFFILSFVNGMSMSKKSSVQAEITRKRQITCTQVNKRIFRFKTCVLQKKIVRKKLLSY